MNLDQIRVYCCSSLVYDPSLDAQCRSLYRGITLVRCSIHPNAQRPDQWLCPGDLVVLPQHFGILFKYQHDTTNIVNGTVVASPLYYGWKLLVFLTAIKTIVIFSASMFHFLSTVCMVVER